MEVEDSTEKTGIITGIFVTVSFAVVLLLVMLYLRIYKYKVDQLSFVDVCLVHVDDGYCEKLDRKGRLPSG